MLYGSSLFSERKTKMINIALITGILGQMNCLYGRKVFLSKGYQVHGIKKAVFLPLIHHVSIIFMKTRNRMYFFYIMAIYELTNLIMRLNGDVSQLIYDRCKNYQSV